MGNENSSDIVKENVLQDFTLQEIANRIKNGEAKRIIVMSGAGISVAAGFPDFRSPGTGLYSQLAKYDLPRPEAVFELSFFREKPEPFFILAKEMWPGTFSPTDAHLFIKLLQDKGVLLRNFTQNIDCLERCAGVEPSYLVECHGSFASAHTIDAPFKEIPISHIKERLDAGETCIRDKETGSLIKPDVVFFGESLPTRVFSFVEADFPTCDLLIVIGTSLSVNPFAQLTRFVDNNCPRLLINNQCAGDFMFEDEVRNYRDVGAIGDCQEIVNTFAKLIGWEEDFATLKAKFPDRLQNVPLQPMPNLEGLSLKAEIADLNKEEEESCPIEVENEHSSSSLLMNGKRTTNATATTTTTNATTGKMYFSSKPRIESFSSSFGKKPPLLTPFKRRSYLHTKFEIPPLRECECGQIKFSSQLPKISQCNKFPRTFFKILKKII